MDVKGEVGDIFQGELIFWELNWICRKPRPLGIMSKLKIQLNLAKM